jgi:PAS domain S-box-containing protein
MDLRDTYDPRQRPWYVKAREEKAIVWTDPYIFYTSQNPGITIAGPIYSAEGELQAIVGVDIEIHQLSTFISKLRIGKNGRAFMLNNNGDVVAFPDQSKIRVTDAAQGGRLRLVKIEEIDDGLSQAAFQAITWSKTPAGRLNLTEAQFARFEYKGQAYHTMFTPFLNQQWPWLIGVFVPESDYLGAIKDNRNHNILLTLGLSVVATLIGLFLSRTVIRSLAELEAEALAIQNDDLDSRFETRSLFKEIQLTADAFTRMKSDIRAGEEKYREIFENIQDIYYEASVSGRILEVSPSVEKVSSYKREELIGMSLDLLYKNPEDRERLLAQLDAHGKVTDFELIMTGKHGETEYCSINACLKRKPSGKPEKIIGSMRLITRRKTVDLQLQRYQQNLEDLVRERTLDLEESNRRLRSSEEKYRSIIESMENGYYETDLDGNLTFFNDHAVEILGLDREKAMGMNYQAFMDSDTVDAVRKRFKEIIHTGASEGVARFSILRPDGKKRTLNASAAPIFDHERRCRGFRGVVLDVTERLSAEEEKKKLENRLQEIQRLEGIGTLAGGVAHDFNNLLMGIQGNVSLMLLEMAQDSPHYSRLKSIESCVQGGSDLTRQLLGFARGGKYNVAALDFNQVVQNTALMFGRTRKDITMHEKMQPHLRAVMADQNQIEQVLLNLYINAWQAMPDGGNIYLETKNVDLSPELARSFDMQPGPCVQISVADTGTGIEEAVRSKIFEPFFTTKEMGRGTGLGLASAYGIVKNHGGAIEFASTVGQGTTFYVYLPASDAEVEAPEKAIRTLSRGNESILLVDDEQVILDVNCSMLQNLGYHVTVARGGQEAVDSFTADSHRFDMVILDMVMPDMNGGLVFDRMKAIDPDVKVLLATGYSITGQAEEIVARGCAGFIQKPYDIKTLSVKIREILDQ